jgi:hypothetical protein
MSSLIALLFICLIFRVRPRKKSPDWRTPGTIVQFTLLVGNGTLAPLFLVTRQPFVDDFNLSECRLEYIPKTKNKSKER